MRLDEEFVYLDESSEVLGDTGNIPTEIYLKCHSCVEIQFALKGDRNAYYKAVVQSRDVHHSTCHFFGCKIRESQNGPTPIRRNPPVFVEVTHLVKAPKRVSFVGVPSVVWLKRINLANSFGRNSLQRSFERLPFWLEQDRAINNWESSTFSGDGLQSDQTPDQLVQRSPHVVDGICRNQTNLRGNIEKLEAKDVSTIFKVILTAESIGIRIGEGCNFPAEKFEMALRPSKFRLHIEHG